MDPLLYDIMGNDGGEFQTSTKTEDEIKKLTLEDGMTETKRTIHILSRGQPIQKLSIYLNLHRILLEPEGFTKIFPLLSEEVLNQTEEAQSEAAKSITKLINNTDLDRSCYLQIFKLLMNIINVWAQPVLDNWANLFGCLLKKLPYSAIAKECEEKLLSLSESSQHGMSKYVAARMIGFIADSGVSNAGLLYDRCKMLCLDADVEVRRILASEVMGRICRAVGTELAENKFMGKVLELLYDQDIIIKLSALETIMYILDVLSEEYFDARLLTVFVDLTSSVNEEVMKRISFHIGNIIYRLESTLEKNKAQMAQIQNAYKEWGLHKNSDVRKNVIYNLPYMIRISDNRDYLKSLYLKALKENDKNIRYTALGCLHEMSKFIGAEEANLTYREIFENALKENDPRLNEKLTKNFHLVTAVFLNAGDEEVKEVTKEVKSSNANNKDVAPKEFPNTFSCIITLGENICKSNNWRLELQYIDNLRQCIDYFDLREISDKYIGYLMARLAKGVDVIRALIQDCIVSFLYKNCISSINANIMKRIATEFFGSTNYQNRLSFLQLYEKLADKFSRTYIKQNNLNDMALSLALDKVSSVRRKFLSVAVTIRRMIFDEDEKTISKLEDAINKLCSAKEKEINKYALETYRELKSLTSYYFEDFIPEDSKRLEREKEQDAEEIKKKQLEEQKDRAGDYLDSYGSRLVKNYYGGKKDPKATPSSGTGPKVGRTSLMIPNPTTKLKYDPPSTTVSKGNKSQTIITTPTINGANGLQSTRKKSDSLTDVDKKSPISVKKETPNLSTIKVDKPDKIDTKVDSKASNTNKENNSKGSSKDTKTVTSTIGVKKK